MGTDANEVAVSSKSIEGKGGPEEEEEEEEEQEEEEELGCCPSWRCRFSSDEEGGSSLPESDSSTTAAGDAEEDAACLMFVSEERRGKERGGRRRRRGRWSRLRRKRHALAREFFFLFYHGCSLLCLSLSFFSYRMGCRIGRSKVSRGVAGAPRGSKQEHGVLSFFLSCFVSKAEQALTILFSLPSPSKQQKMSFAMTANFFYAVVVAGLAYNVFILYAGASAAKLALGK